MRIVISGHEICGMLGDFAAELQASGHEVVSIAMPHPFFASRRYDYDQYDFLGSYMRRRFGESLDWGKAAAALWRLSPDAHRGVERHLRKRIVRDADMYIRIWAKIPFDEEILSSLDPARTRILSFFMGSDVRDYDIFKEEYRLHQWTFPEEYYGIPFAEKIRALRVHERFADVIFSVPDQMGLAIRPYHHLQVPVRIEELGFAIHDRAIPKVIHAPSAPGAKGTDVIDAALATLKSEGVSFEYSSLRNVPRPELLGILSDSDVLVDELVGHGPGWLSFEAMASGCAVATRHLDDSPPCFSPPVWSIDQHNIVPRLRELLTDAALRRRLASEGRAYVEANNTLGHVVRQVMEKATEGRAATTDYVPRYLTTEYEPKSDDELRALASANSLVIGENWFAGAIAGCDAEQLARVGF